MSNYMPGIFSPIGHDFNDARYQFLKHLLAVAQPLVMYPYGHIPSEVGVVARNGEIVGRERRTRRGVLGAHLIHRSIASVRQCQQITRKQRTGGHKRNQMPGNFLENGKVSPK